MCACVCVRVCVCACVCVCARMCVCVIIINFCYTNYVQVIWNKLYAQDSFCNKGTLKHLQNIIRRTNVPNKVKDNVSAAQDFYSVVFEAHVVAAALSHFSMSSLDSEPAGIEFPDDPTKLHDFMMQTVGTLVDKHVLKFTETTTLPENSTQLQTATTQERTEEDSVNNYASLVIGYGLMAGNFHDAWREGDGGRLLRCWKFLLLHFRVGGRTKYTLEAFKLLALTSALLTPRKAHQLTWNRTCNRKGGHGHNIPLDLDNEFLNRVFKDNINTFRQNITSHSVDRSSQSLKRISDTLENFDKITNIRHDSGHHALPDSSEDFRLILQVLQTEQVFTFTPHRAHTTFKKISADPFSNLKLKELHKWLKRHRKNASIEQAVLYNKF